MTEPSLPPLSPPDSLAGLAARHFARALSWTQLLAVTAAVLAALPTTGRLEDLPEIEAGLQRAWPAQAGRPPVCDRVWTGDASGGAARGLQLCAFDEAGRVLLQRSYNPWPARAG